MEPPSCCLRHGHLFGNFSCQVKSGKRICIWIFSLKSTTPDFCPLWGWFCFYYRPGLFPLNLSLASPLLFLPWLLSCSIHTQHLHCQNRRYHNWAIRRKESIYICTSVNAFLCLQDVIACVNYIFEFIVGNIAGCSDTPTGLELQPLSSFPTTPILLSLLTKVHCYSTSVKLSKRGQLGSDKTSSCVMWKKWMWWCMKCNHCSNISETLVGNSLVMALIDRLSSLL